MKKGLKYSYLSLGVIHFLALNYISYFVEPYSLAEPLYLKIILSVLSLALFVFIYILLIKPTLIFKKPLSKETVITLYIGVLIVPLISLYY